MFLNKNGNTAQKCFSVYNKFAVIVKLVISIDCCITVMPQYFYRLFETKTNKKTAFIMKAVFFILKLTVLIKAALKVKGINIGSIIGLFVFQRGVVIRIICGFQYNKCVIPRRFKDKI